MAPNFAPLWGAARPAALRIPHADKRRGAPPGDACGIVVAPMALVQIPNIRLIRRAVVALPNLLPRLASVAWGCATAAGGRVMKQGARVARRRDCAAFGYVVNRATSDRVQPLRFFILVGSRGGVPP